MNYGYKKSDIPTSASIIFFELDAHQISWHTDILFNEKKIYTKAWDKQECSNLTKIEQFITDNFKKELKEEDYIKNYKQIMQENIVYD